MTEDIRAALPKHRNPVKVIRDKCLNCCCGSSKEVELCPVGKCPLHPFRFGRNPYREKREESEEARQAARERLANARARKKNEQGVG